MAQFIEVPMTFGLVALIDIEDADRVLQYKWYPQFHPNDLIYAQSYMPGPGPGYPMRIYIKLHRFVLDAPKGLIVHHIDGDGLNCQRNNLQLMTLVEHRKLHSSKK